MNVNDLINYLFETVHQRKFLDEAALRGFSLDILKKETQRLKEEYRHSKHMARDIGERLCDLADKYKLPYMGIGSSRSRKVYALSTSKALKISIERRGVAQTEAEVSIWTNPSTQEVAAQIFDFDPDYMWSVMEIVKTFKHPRHYKKSLEYELGIPNSYSATFTIEDIVVALLSDRSDGLPENITEQLGGMPRGEAIELRSRIERYLEDPHPFVNKIVDLVKNNDLETGDIHSGHFGKTADGRIVLIDYGFTEDVAKLY